MANNNSIESLDYLAVFSGFIGVLNYYENLKQTSNNDIQEELHQQNEKYLKVIIEQNNKIIELLERR